MVTGRIRIGISGWRYAGWRGRFYPNGLPQRLELQYAANAFGTIELNGTHYSLQKPEFFERWRDDTPADFVFAIKGSRFITHMLQLNKCEPALANFFAQGLLKLGPKLGPILWQFSPRFVFNPEKLERFFSLLPRTTDDAAKLAKNHDDRLAGRSWIRSAHHANIRHAIEVRHDSFLDAAFVRLLRRYDTGLVVADTVAWPLMMDLTSDYVYARLHGSRKLYVSGYGPKALDVWAERTLAWAAGRDAEGPHASAEQPQRRKGRDVFVYFDNDAKVRAPVDAASLIKRVTSRVN
jgi:uncharacterized protein YecE (DUF72 family)